MCSRGLSLPVQCSTCGEYGWCGRLLSLAAMRQPTAVFGSYETADCYLWQLRGMLWPDTPAASACVAHVWRHWPTDTLAVPSDAFRMLRASSTPHQRLINASSTPHQRLINAASTPHQCLINASSMPHRRLTNAHQLLITPHISHCTAAGCRRLVSDVPRDGARRL